MENFSFNLFNSLNEAQQKDYITKYFIPLTTGDHLLYKDGSYEMINNDIFNRTYLNRLPDKLKKYYTKEFTGLKTPVYKLNKPLFYDDKINLCQQLPESKPYDTFDDSTKSKVKMMLDYIYEVLANNNKAIYEHLLKWLSNMMKGNKNDACIVLKTYFEGVGKSTLPQFINKHVLGNKLTLETGSEPLISRFNSILSGKLFVYFEELETFSVAQWMGVSSVLKRLITSEFTTYEGKGTDRYEAENINNYFILSNHDVQDEGRRFFVLDINVARMHDKEYWKKLYGECFNDEVGYAFYCFLRELDTTNYKAQNYPITQSKLNSINKRLDTAFLFLKHEYLLKKKDINISLKELYAQYCSYCAALTTKKPHGKIEFNNKLESINIKYYKSHGVNKFKVSYEDIKAISEKFNWIHSLDEFEPDFIDDDNDDEPIGYKTKYERSQETITQLQNQIKELQDQLKKLKAPTETTEELESEDEDEDEITSLRKIKEKHNKDKEENLQAFKNQLCDIL